VLRRNIRIGEQVLTNAAAHEDCQLSEADAIRLANAGDSRAFERLYRLHSRQVYRVCLRMTGSPTEAEDLTQDAFLQLFRNLKSFRGEARFSTWLYRLTFNTVLMRKRRKRRLEIPPEVFADTGGDEALPIRELGAPDLLLAGVLDHVNLSRALRATMHLRSCSTRASS
jgi:RNA polymerase sigma-70 factor (ECF subfamily)